MGVDLDGEALLGPFVGHRQALQLLAVGAPVEHEVVAPHLVRPVGACGRGRPVAMRLRGRVLGTCSFACLHSR